MTSPDVTEALRDSFAAALRAVEPGVMVESNLPDEEPALILAAGKGALGMLAPARRRWPTVRWLAAPPHDVAAGAVADEYSGMRGQVISGSHPLPDEGSVTAARAAITAVGRLGPEDLVLVLLSGGGSSLWSAPRGVSLSGKRELISRLLLAGADIDRLNAVRKHLSFVKGGQLARATRARLLTLALSDVPGDDPATIASGPTVPDASTYQRALAVLDEFGVTAPAARSQLEAGVAGLVDETPKPGDELEARSHALVIGSNRTLLDAAADYWRAAGYPVILLSDALQGEARVLAKAHADLATALAHGEDPGPALAALAPAGQAAAVIQQATGIARVSAGRPLVVLSGGEATVTVTGKGRGGRNQEFALWLHHYLRRAGSDEHVAALAAGSDGIDGNSPAAGATISEATGARAEALDLSPAAHLRDNDSYTFFAGLGDALVTGPTGTNLNDYRALVVIPAR